MTRHQRRILDALVECPKARAYGHAIRSGLHMPIADFVDALGLLEEEGMIVEDRHNRGVIVLTAVGAARFQVQA